MKISRPQQKEHMASPNDGNFRPANNSRVISIIKINGE